MCSGSRLEISVAIKRLDGSDDLPLPRYHSAYAAGMDLHAAVSNCVAIQPGQIQLIPCGFAVAVPAGYEAQLRPRSGLAYKHGVTLINSPGTIDSDYRGEIGVILINHGDAPFTVARGMRIAQLVLAPVVRAVLAETHCLPKTARGANGFGSTGLSAKN